MRGAGRNNEILAQGASRAAGADVFRQSAREWIGFARDDAGKLWIAGWKQTDDGKMYLNTIHRAKPEQLQQAEKKWRRVKNERLGVGKSPLMAQGRLCR